MAFNFGSTPFATPAATTAGFSFGSSTNPASNIGVNLFGSNPSGISGISSSSFTGGTNLPATTSFFGQSVPSVFNKPETQLPPSTSTEALLAALFCPKVFGDERDSILARWNQLQAAWGTGHGFYLPTFSPVHFTPDNQFGRFKAIGYSYLPQSKNEDGLVALLIAKEPIEVVSQQEALVVRLHQILGGRANVQVCVDAVKVLPDNRSEIIIFVQERNPSGMIRRSPASELFQFLQQSSIRAQLQNLAVTDIALRCSPTPEQLKQYLDTPPLGIDLLIWQQAKLDNPCPNKLIPVPMIGFKELHRRLKLQEIETKQHQGRLDLIADCIGDLNRKHAQNITKIDELKQKHIELSHLLLKVMAKQEVNRKLGTAIQQEEEQLKASLECLHAQLSAPNQFKGRLNELLSQIFLQLQMAPVQGDRLSLDPCALKDVKQVLKMHQEGLNHLVSVIKEDMADLKIMSEALHTIKL